jgi:tetratricopeptide (TPR) repeat protein
MDNSKKKIIRQILIIFVIYTLAITALAQENETRAAPQQGVEVIDNKNTTFLELSQNYDEDVITGAQRNFDRSLDILNIVASLLGVLVGLLTLIIAIVGGLGFFEIKKWHNARKNIDKDIEIIKETRNTAEKELDMLRKHIEKTPLPSLLEEPSEEIMKNLDEFASKTELYEILGVTLNSEDYLKRATDFYFKEKYELAIEAYEKAMESKPNNVEAWFNKGVALGKLGRHDEALNAIEKAIELKPDYIDAWFNKGVALDKLGRHDEALKAYEKKKELKPDDASGL